MRKTIIGQILFSFFLFTLRRFIFTPTDSFHRENASLQARIKRGNTRKHTIYNLQISHRIASHRITANLTKKRFNKAHHKIKIKKNYNNKTQHKKKEYT
jgi:hypothetical protein